MAQLSILFAPEYRRNVFYRTRWRVNCIDPDRARDGRKGFWGQLLARTSGGLQRGRGLTRSFAADGSPAGHQYRCSGAHTRWKNSGLRR